MYLVMFVLRFVNSDETVYIYITVCSICYGDYYLSENKCFQFKFNVIISEYLQYYCIMLFFS